jgi:hypothetical protein
MPAPGSNQDLPSSSSVKAAIRGEPGGWFKVLASTGLRSLLVAPGVWFGGARGWKLAVGSLLGSTTITMFLFIWYGVQEVDATPVMPPLPPPQPQPGNGGPVGPGLPPPEPNLVQTLQGLS